MPLRQGYSARTQSANIREAIQAGVSQNQAVAMALESARRSAAKRRVPEKGPKEFKGKSQPAGTPVRRSSGAGSPEKGVDMAKKKKGAKKGAKKGTAKK